MKMISPDERKTPRLAAPTGICDIKIIKYVKDIDPHST